jgi:NTE family protein
MRAPLVRRGGTHDDSSVFFGSRTVAVLMPTGVASFFDGLSTDEVERTMGTLERRRFPAGSVVIAEGDLHRELYIVEAGAAEVLVSDRQGVQHRVGRINPGATLGEMSLFSDQPAAGTVRATQELDVAVLTERDLERAAAIFPQIYRNLGAILSERLARTNRLSVSEAPGRVVVLDDDAAPSLLGYALTCSVAWHTRRPTVLAVVGEALPEPLAELATGLEPPLHRRDGVRRGAEVVLVDHSNLASTVEELCHSHDHVLVQRPGSLAHLDGARIFKMGAAELAREDVESLRGGLLPSTTPAGKTLGLAARDLADLKVGIALGIGSLRGYAHVGVLRFFERIGLIPDCLAGSSIGAAVAGLSALGKSADEVGEALDEHGKTLFRIGMPIRGLVSNRALKRSLQATGGEINIEDLPVPLAIVAADIGEMREVVFRRGLLWRAVLASCAIPGVYPAQRIGPYTLVDGGVLSPVPTTAAADLGAGTVIAIRLGAEPVEPVTDAVAGISTGRPPSAVSVIVRSIELMQSRIAAVPTSPTITVAPEFAAVPSARLRRFSEGRRYVEIGEAAAEAALPRIAAAFPWLDGRPA